jgi:hypothetical protein
VAGLVPIVEINGFMTPQHNWCYKEGMKNEWLTTFLTKVFTQSVDSKNPTCMASHSQDNPHTLSTPKMSNSPQKEEENLFSDIPYVLT